MRGWVIKTIDEGETVERRGDQSFMPVPYAPWSK
jgi:hypothetical protein